MPSFLQRSEFTRNIFILASGSSVAQLIPVLSEPIISRIFTPEEFGIYEVYIAIIMILGVVATARYEMAIVLPRTENKAVNILGLSLFIVLVFSLVILMLILSARSAVLALIPAEGFDEFLIYVPLGILIFGINRSFFMWMIRRKRMRTISLSRITESSTKAGGSIFLGILNFSSLGLILGQIAGQFFSGMILVWNFLSRDRKNLVFLSWKAAGGLFKKYREFPIVNVPIALSETLQISGIIFVLAFYYDNASVGEFSKALRILLIPLYLIGSSISQVFYQKASKDFNRGIDITVSLRKIVNNLLKWSVLPLILFIAVSPWLFGIVLGPQWTTSGEYARILAVWIFIKFITSPVSVIPLIIDRQRIYLLLNLAGNLLMIIAVVVPSIIGTGILTTMYCLGISQALFSIVLYLTILSIAKKSFTGPAGPSKPETFPDE